MFFTFADIRKNLSYHLKAFSCHYIGMNDEDNDQRTSS